jgi:co-chaperonin GroES (HSP10)
MNSLGQFIIRPLNDRYNNQVKVGDKNLITNTKVEDWRSVSKEAVVVATPKALKTDIKPGDKVIVHHNIFRRWYDIRGVEKNGSTFFKDNMYFASPDQIYMYQKNKQWYTNMDYCFVAPVVETDVLKNQKEKELVGILKYSNKSLEALKITSGDLIGFKPNSEFEFVFDNKRLYCMKSNDIVIKYEYKGNEKEYHPSWANSR